MAEISILTPSYNYGRFIGDTIASVDNQQIDASVEHVIQDAVSHDETAKIARGHALRVQRKLIVEPDGGQSDALNRALAASSGWLIGWLNADEFYLPGALACVLAAARTDPTVEMFFGDCIFVDEDGHFERLLPSHRPSRFVLRHYGCYISSCAVFLRREVLERNPWMLDLREAMDWELWLRVAERSRMSYLKRPLAAFRVHGSQVTELGQGRASRVERSSELKRIDELHSIRRRAATTVAATAAHRGLKLRDRAYARERRASKEVGGEMMAGWWNGRESAWKAVEI